MSLAETFAEIALTGISLSVSIAMFFVTRFLAFIIACIPFAFSLVLYYLYRKDNRILIVGVLLSFILLPIGLALGVLCVCPFSMIGLICVGVAAYYVKMSQENEERQATKKNVEKASKKTTQRKTKKQ